MGAKKTTEDLENGIRQKLEQEANARGVSKSFLFF
jgi:hypothetical protein